jgi:hypothetical protein
MLSQFILQVELQIKLLCSFGPFLLAFCYGFVFLKLYGFVYSFEFWLQSRDEAGKNQKDQGSATDDSVLLHYNARALANQIACYIPLTL